MKEPNQWSDPSQAQMWWCDIEDETDEKFECGLSKFDRTGAIRTATLYSFTSVKSRVDAVKDGLEPLKTLLVSQDDVIYQEVQRWASEGSDP